MQTKNQTNIISGRNENVNAILKKIQEFSGGLPGGSSAYSIPLTTSKTKPIETEEAFNKNIKSLQEIKDRLNLLKALRVKVNKTSSNTNLIPQKHFFVHNNSLPLSNSRKSIIKSTVKSIKTTSTKATTTTPTTTAATYPSSTASSTTTITKEISTLTKNKVSTLLPRKANEKATKMSENEYVVNPQTNHIDWVKTYQQRYNSGLILKFEGINNN
jgi:hypothetical protein